MVLDRRGFLKFAAGASAGLMATPIPWKLLDDVSIWSQNWSWIPRNQKGESTFVHTISKMCPSGVPMRVRLVNGRPVRVLPNESHPLGGGVTSLAVAEVQMMHSPGRVKRPLIKGPDGGWLEVQWAVAGDMLQEKLKAAGANIAFISGDETGSTNEVLSAFAKSAGSSDVFLMPSEGQSAAVAADRMGIKARFGYDLERSDYVLAIGANILESWGTVVRNRRIFRNSHPHPAPEAKASVTFAYAGSVQNNTAAVAAPWLPIYPGTEGILALGIANMLIAKGRTAPASDFKAFTTLAAAYTPEETARLTGADPKKLEEIVTALLSAKAPLVIVGSEFNQGAGAAPIIAGFAVNALLDNINKPGGLMLLPEAPTVLAQASPRSALYKNDLTEWLFKKDKKTSVLVLHEANPVYALPNPAEVADAVKAIPFKVSFSTFLDETAALCDMVLPIGMGLERIDDIDTPYGCGANTYCVGLPVSEPTESIRNTGNAMLYFAKKLGMSLGFDLFEDVLAAKAKAWGSSIDALVKGQAAVKTDLAVAQDVSFNADILGQALEVRPLGDKLHLAPYAKLNLGTAKTGIPPYNTKTLRASELDGSTMFVMMNAATAAKKGLRQGDALVLDSGKQKIKARLRVFEGVMTDTVAVCLGYGHTALDEFSQNKGANVMELMTATSEFGTGVKSWTRTGVTVAKA